VTPDWTEYAACRGMDVAIFHPETGSRRSDPGAVNAWRRALRTCAKCPVRKPCLETALTWEEPRWLEIPGRWSRPLPEGVWGGTRPAERHTRAVIHRDDCPKRGCRGCRPIAERIEILEDTFVNTARKRGLLTEREVLA